MTSGRVTVVSTKTMKLDTQYSPDPRFSRSGFLMRMAWRVLRKRRTPRDTSAVTREYSEGWGNLEKHLVEARSLDEWLSIPGFDVAEHVYNRNGQPTYGTFDSSMYYRDCLAVALKRHFPLARSITEYGAGVGRNLLFLKSENPSKSYFGYELCPPGISISKAAAAKFGQSIEFAQLDYLNDPPEKYIFPEFDVAFTMFSLEQIPRNVSLALQNILSRAKLGSIHIEPVPEHYPLSLTGLLGKLDHWKSDYLSGFDRSVRELDGVEIHREQLSCAHNPLMFPSAYVLRKI